MGQKIVVNDTNILIDLSSVKLLDAFFELDFDMRTLEVLMNEVLDKKAREDVLKFIERKKLRVVELTDEQSNIAFSMLKNRKRNESFEDCAAWLYAKEENAILLTGDANLRKSAEADNVEVHGVIIVFDELVKSGIVTPRIAAERLAKLSGINTRLPMREIDRRLALWSDMD